jgi:hypothetical protein
MQGLISHQANSLQVLRGCVKLLPLPQPPLRATPVARPHGRTDKPKRPETHSTKERARARVRCRKTEPNYYYCPINFSNVMIDNTSVNEVHYIHN